MLSVPIIIRNGVKLNYPLHLVVQSVVGLADEVLISADPTSEDDTIDYVHDIMLEVNSTHPGLVRYVESPWDLSNINKKGTEFSRQTNIAIDKCKGDWILSLQADEAVHEDHFDRIKREILHSDVDALSCERIYFYGNINKVRVDWTHDIVRLYRKGLWRSCGDGMNSVSCGGRPPRQGPFKLYHYSRIGDPEVISKRILSLDKLFHPADKLLTEEELEPYEFRTYNFDCMHKQNVDLGRKRVPSYFKVYGGTHPAPFKGYRG